MKNNLLFRKKHKSLLFLSFVLLFLLNCHLSVGQNIAVWDSPDNGSDWLDTHAVTTKDNNVTVTALTKGSGLGGASTSAGYSYGGSGADQSTQANAIANGDFFTMTIKANTGYKISLTGIPNWFTRRSGSGGTCSIVTQYSLNGGAYSDIGSISVTSTSGGGSSTPLAFPAGVQTALANLPSTTTVTFRFVVVSSTSRNIYFLTGTSSATTARFAVSGTVAASTPSVNLSVSSNAASEASPAAITVTATASSAVTGNQTVDIAVSGEGITAGDYTLGNNKITILNGQTTGSTTFTVVDDAEYEGEETAVLTISNPTSGLVLGATTTRTIVISDNDLPPNPMFTIVGTLAHGAVCPTVAATTRTYTITNSGTAASDVMVTSGDPQFVVSNLSSTSIGATNGTATYDVTFTPTTNGAKSSVISVYYNASTLAATTTVTGTGTTTVSQAVTSSSATVVTAKTATLNGNVTTLGVCPASTQKGFVYSKSSDNANPEIDGSGVTATPVGSIGTGAFTLALTGLAASTQYSFKAYVFNGTAYTYGALQTFTTSPALSISGTLNNGTVCPTFSAAPQTYTVTNNSLVAVTDVSVSSSDPQFVVSAISSTTIAAGATATYTVTFTPSGAGSKSATVTVSGTEVISVTNNPTGIGATPVTQAVSSSAASSVVNTTATLNGVYNTAGACPSTNEKGFVYSVKALNDNPLVDGDSVIKRTVTLGSTGAYAIALTGLTPSTVYTFKAYVYNGTTYTYGTATDFTTLAVASKLVFSVAPPTAGTVSTNLTSFTVQAQRPNNTVDTEYNTAIALTRNIVSGAASLTGTTTVTPTAGVATFTAVQFNGVGVYKIAASSGALTPTPASANITVTSAPVSLAAWNFSATMMNGAPPTPATNANVTVGPLTRGSAVTTSGTNYTREWGGYGWSTSTNLTTAANAGSFLSFTIKANANYLLSLNTIPAYDFYSSNTGPGLGQWQYSINGGAFTNVGATLTFASSGVNSFSAIDLSSVAALQNLPSTTTVTFRIVGYDSGSTTSGTFAFYDSTGSTAADFSVVGNIVATPVVNLSVSSNSASEASPEIITVTATANTPVSGAQTVNVSVSGTNITAADYTLGSGIITITDGETTGTTTFIVVDDTLAEDTQTAIITISNPSSGIVLGTTRTQSITILDNDIPPPTFGGIAQTEASCDGSAGIFTVSGLIPSVSTTITYTTSSGLHTATFIPSTATAIFNSVVLSHANDNGQLLTVTAIKRNDTNQEVNLTSDNTAVLSINPLQTPTLF